MQSVLYLSDLDGTLLDRNAVLPPSDAARINRLTAEGVMFSFATARTVRSVSHILRDVDFTHPGAAPVALMNGTMIRDMREGRYLAVEKIPPDAVRRVMGAMDETGAEPFVYTVDPVRPVEGDPLLTSYRRLANDCMRRFRDERIEKYGKPFARFSLPEDLPGETVYFCVLGDEALVRRTAAAADFRVFRASSRSKARMPRFLSGIARMTAFTVMAAVDAMASPATSSGAESAAHRAMFTAMDTAPAISGILPFCSAK